MYRYRCKDCGALIGEYEVEYYQIPGARWCTGWDLDHENEMMCPDCGSFNLEEEGDEDDETD